MNAGSTRQLNDGRYNSNEPSVSQRASVHDPPASAASPSAPWASPQVALIAAVAKNGVIGAHNRLPWRLPDDMKRFRMLTMGHAVIMGRKTWHSIGKPLPGRQNIVLTRGTDLATADCTVAHTLEEAIARASLPDPVFVIGGENVYRAALPFATHLYLTEIERDFAGDARFPTFDRRQWREIEREARQLDGPDGFAYYFAAYERVGA